MVEGSVTYDFTLRWFGTAFGLILLGSHNFMVTALAIGSCVKWPLGIVVCKLHTNNQQHNNVYPMSHMQCTMTRNLHICLKAQNILGVGLRPTHNLKIGLLGFIKFNPRTLC